LAADRPLALPRWLQARIEAEAARFLFDGGGAIPDFSKPAGEPALAAPDSVSWRVFKNPIALFIGGVSAVLLELAEPRVRTGVWEHTSFRTDAVRRLQRTGLAAMMTVYGPKTESEAMIARVRRVHSRIAGQTPSGEAYRADDPELLNWVHATAAFGFVEAYNRFVRPLSGADMSRFYAEGERTARLYGATGTPRSDAELRTLFDAMRPKLQPSPIIFEFLDIMRRAPIFPPASRPFQRLLVRAATDMLPGWARALLALNSEWELKDWQRRVVRSAGRIADRIPLGGSPPVEACRRLGLPETYLFTARS
jgi:uncharacterized protein (DUF2236 family)